MATYTPNYNLEKPAQTDIYNIDVFNANADKVDTALGEKAEQTMLAPVEKTNIASQNYVKDAYFVYNGYLCIATAPIAMGGTIAIGTNCASTAAGTELKSIKDALTITSGSIKLSAFPNFSSGTGFWWKFGKVVFFNVVGVVFSNQSSSMVSHLTSLSALEMPVGVATNFDYQCGSGNTQMAELYLYPTNNFDIRTYSTGSVYGCGFYIVN